MEFGQVLVAKGSCTNAHVKKVAYIPIAQITKLDVLPAIQIYEYCLVYFFLLRCNSGSNYIAVIFSCSMGSTKQPLEAISREALEEKQLMILAFHKLQQRTKRHIPLQ
ncbi:Hut1p [Saccharomyces cerevisiae FostersO]|nr:Hut1p [Saccharomyces cerevisiae FostersO]